MLVQYGRVGIPSVIFQFKLVVHPTPEINPIPNGPQCVVSHGTCKVDCEAQPALIIFVS